MKVHFGAMHDPHATMKYARSDFFEYDGGDLPPAMGVDTAINL